MTGRLGGLAGAFQAEVQRRAVRAMLIATGAGLLAVFALGASFLPSGLSSSLLLSYGLFLLVFGVVLAALLLQGFGGQFGDALAVAGWARLDAEERRRAAGAGRIARSPAEARAWLAAHPDPARHHSPRLAAHILAGELAAARETLATYPSGTPFERFEIADDAWFLDFLEGGSPPLAQLEAAAGELHDQRERTFAAVVIATLRAHLAVATGEDWMVPLAAERGRLAQQADGIVGSRYVVATWTIVMVAASVMVGIALLVGRATGIWPSG